MFGPKSFEVEIFNKTKTWWENLKKIHVPEERSKFSADELAHLVKANQLIQMEVRKMQVLKKVKLANMIDFQKLKKAFSREYPFAYGKPINQKID